MEIDKLNDISKLLKQNPLSVTVIDGKFYVVEINKKFIEELTKIGLETEKDVHGYRVKLKVFFENVIPFVELKYFESKLVESEFLILNNNGDYCYLCEQTLNFNDDVNEEFKIKCNNLISYFKLYNTLKSDTFSDHHNSGNKEIVIYTSTNGIFKIKYEIVPEVKDNVDYSESISKLIALSNSIELKLYCKNSFFIFSKGVGSISLEDIIINADDIVSTSKRDYELVSKQFSFENFRDSLIKEKEKYFCDVREIINKIFSQAIGIPLSISATAFATFKVTDNTPILIIILLAFILYVFFYIKIQLIYKSDLKEIKTDFLNDFEIIETKSGLEKHVVDSEKIKIDNKIKNSITIINWLIGTVLILGLLMFLFILLQILNIQCFCLPLYILSLLN